MATKKHQNNKDSQLDKAASILAQLKPNVTPDDRKAAAKELELHEITVDRYLAGEIRRLETAMGLIRVFRIRIEERERELTA